MDVIIVFVLLTSPLVVLWLIRGDNPFAGDTPCPGATDTVGGSPAQHALSAAKPEAALTGGIAWSVLDDCQVARLLSGSDPRTNAD